MRGSSISFLRRASIAWLDSCFGSFLCILALCHESKEITGQFGTHRQFQNCFYTKWWLGEGEMLRKWVETSAAAPILTIRIGTQH